MKMKRNISLKINGMMCKHCQARVKKVLEEMDGVKEAIVSHEKDEAIIILSKDIEDSVLIDIIEKEDYKVHGIEVVE